MTGVELIEEIRKTDDELPVFLVTGHSQEQFNKQDFTTSTYFLRKPYDRKALYEQIDACLALPKKSPTQQVNSSTTTYGYLNEDFETSFSTGSDSGLDDTSAGATRGSSPSETTTTIPLASRDGDTTVGSPEDSGDADNAMVVGTLSSRS